MSTGPVATAARLPTARLVGGRYAGTPGVLGVLCGGSVGRGHADPWSDLELVVLWDAPPDGPELTRLRRRVARYPDGVAAAVARRPGDTQFFRRWRRYLERGNRHGLAAHFAEVARALEQVLAALNRRWWPGPRWPSWSPDGLGIAPPEVAARRAAAATEPRERAA
ncbi:MAG TPA: hypothetical protein VGD67_10755, partial [Pseudonocardiaceae bacterium]